MVAPIAPQFLSKLANPLSIIEGGFVKRFVLGDIKVTDEYMTPELIEYPPLTDVTGGSTDGIP